MRATPCAIVLLIATLLAACARVPGQDVPDVRTPPAVVNEMLRLANVTADDVVYDLGSGDGRIVIAAARDRGARGVGYEIDPALVRQATEQARRLGLAERHGDPNGYLTPAPLPAGRGPRVGRNEPLPLRLRPKVQALLPRSGPRAAPAGPLGRGGVLK